MAACWVFDDEQHPVADLALERARWDAVRVPALWWFEIGNFLAVNQRRGRVAAQAIPGILDALERLGVEIDGRTQPLSLVNLAGRYRLSAYDAAYLHLAQRERIPLATLDRALMRACRAEGVELIHAE